MEMYTLENGKIIKHMEAVCIFTKMGQAIQVIGMTTSSMVLVLKNGRMAHAMKGNIFLYVEIIRME